MRHGAIWYDGSGEMRAWREALHHYPEKIWLIRLAEEIFHVWQHGEYNFVQRVAKRRDPLTKAICLAEFVAGVMRMVLLLNRDYTPYWKWLSHEFRKLDAAQWYAPLLEELVTVDNTERQMEIMLGISAELQQTLRKNGLITDTNEHEHLLPLLAAHLELLERGTVNDGDDFG